MLASLFLLETEGKGIDTQIPKFSCMFEMYVRSVLDAGKPVTGFY